MPTSLHVLGQNAPVTTSEAPLYTVPAATTTVVSSIIVCNTSTTPTTFCISIAVEGGATQIQNYIYYNMPINSNDTFIATVGITLAATDEVRITAGNTTLSFSIFGEEIS